jgi:hypothetical protein
MNQFQHIVEWHAMAPGTIELAQEINGWFPPTVDPERGYYAFNELWRQQVRVV